MFRGGKQPKQLGLQRLICCFKHSQEHSLLHGFEQHPENLLQHLDNLLALLEHMIDLLVFEANAQLLGAQCWGFAALRMLYTKVISYGITKSSSVV